MARYYRTDSATFIPWDASASVGGAVDVSSFFGDLKALPQDAAIAEGIVSGYEQQINNLARALQQNPRSFEQLRPQAQQLRSNIANDLRFGQLRAITDRYSQYNTGLENLKKVAGTDQGLLNALTGAIQVEDLNYDPQSRTAGRVVLPDAVTPISGEDQTKWLQTTMRSIEPEIVRQVNESQRLAGGTEYVTTLGEVYGRDPNRVVRTLAQSITPDMIRSEQMMERYLRGGQVDQSQFLMQDEEGNLVPNRNTTYGALIGSALDALSGEEVKTSRVKSRDLAAEERLKGNERIRVARANKKLDEEETQWLADKYISILRGEGGDTTTKGDGQARVQHWDFAQGLKLKDGTVITGANRVEGGPPHFVVRREEKVEATQNMIDNGQAPAGTRVGEIITRKTTTSIPVSLETINSIYGPVVTNRIKNSLEREGLYDEDSADAIIIPDQTPIRPMNPGANLSRIPGRS